MDSSRVHRFIVFLIANRYEYPYVLLIQESKAPHMEREPFLQNLRDHTLEEGRTYLQEHIAELSNHTTIGEWLADEALRLLYTPLLSLKIAELLTFFGEYAAHLSSHALGLKAKGDAFLQIGHYEASIESLDAAGEEFLSLGDKGNWARSRISWVSSAGHLGRIDEALQATEQARTVFSQLGEQYWVGVIDNNAAIVYEFIGQYQDAIRLYEHMLAIFSTVTDQSKTALQRSIALTQANQARSLSWFGKLEQAYTLLQQAQTCLMALKEMALVNGVEIELADLDYIQGFYGSALRRYYQARDGMAQDNADNPVFLAKLKLDMANCLVKLNRPQEASSLSEEAVQTYRQFGLSVSIGNALSKHARVLVASRRLEEALAALDEAQVVFTHGGFEALAFVARLQQAEISLQIGSFATAYTLAQTTRQYFDTQKLIVRSIQASLLMAGALLANAQQTSLPQERHQQTALLQEAMSLCRQAISQARQHHLQEEIYRGHYLLGGIFALQNNLSKAAKHYGVAIAQIERILDDLLYDLSPSFLRTTWAVYEDMIALCLRQSQPEDAFSYLEQARSMALRQHLSRSAAALQKHEQAEDAVSAIALRTQYDLRNWQEQHRKYSMLLADMDTSLSPDLNRDIIQAELKHCEEKLNELFERLYLYEASTSVGAHDSHFRNDRRSMLATHRVQHIDIAQVRQHLSADHLLLSYYMHQGKLVIFAITASNMMVHEYPEGQAQVERLLLLLHAHLQAQSWFAASHPSQKAVRRLLNKLYDLLLAPVASLLPPTDGYLTIVPYGSLHKLPFHALYNGSRFLIEDYQVNYLPATGLLTHLAQRTSQLHDTAKRTAQPPLVLGYSSNGHLQRVRDEANTIATLLEGNCYLEEEATIARLIQQAPSSPIIHLATHGRSRLDAPNFSYVRLADGQLTRSMPSPSTYSTVSWSH